MQVMDVDNILVDHRLAERALVLLSFIAHSYVRGHIHEAPKSVSMNHANI